MEENTLQTTQLSPRKPQIVQTVELTSRERLILRSVIHNYILSASPVGSRTLAKRYNVNLSAATIRNTMSDLEDKGLLYHPHTSAGRIPTDLGYRIYVDDMMHVTGLSDEIQHSIRCGLDPLSSSPEADDVLNKISHLLAEASSLLAVITAPDISSGILEKVALVRVASGRIMVVVVVGSGLVRNILLEIDSSITDDEIHYATALINQRLAGLRLTDIPRHITSRLSGEGCNRNEILRLFLNFPDKIFASNSTTEVYVGDRRHVLNQPEFQSHEEVQGIIELIEDRDIIVHLLKDRNIPGISVTIGEENRENLLKNMSVITSTYRIGDVLGSIGIIGPTRMNYARLVALLDYTSRLVSEKVFSNRENDRR
ncbi:MAG: heat-inducible transcriptional repressor HrcA [Candidatus Electryoneaceae bacterium]|nr:heat-inducible transcriptional repressor HrcA [Candidatus Electryoneaceae bacterium]